MATTITLNVYSINKETREAVLCKIDNELFQQLSAYIKIADVDLGKEILAKLQLLDDRIQNINEVVAIAGDASDRARFDNIILRKLLPYATIHTDGDKRLSYHCYAGYDCTVKHANDILHSDTSSAVNCALSQLDFPKFALVYSVLTDKPVWVIKSEVTKSRPAPIILPQ